MNGKNNALSISSENPQRDSNNPQLPFPGLGTAPQVREGPSKNDVRKHMKEVGAGVFPQFLDPPTLEMDFSLTRPYVHGFQMGPSSKFGPWMMHRKNNHRESIVERDWGVCRLVSGEPEQYGYTQGDGQQKPRWIYQFGAARVSTGEPTGLRKG